MKRITAALIALTVVIGLGTSCQKEMESRQEISGNGTGLKVTAIIADNGTKVSYQEDNTDHSLQPGWEVGDILIGFDGNDDSKTYSYKVTGVNDDGVATLAIITEDNVDKGEYKGSSTSDPANGTTMYMFYAPGKKPSDISDKSLTVSIASQANDVVPTLMMAQATVANSSLSLSFTNKTAIIGVKALVMADKNKQYTSLELSGSVGLNTDVKFALDGETLKASYQTSGTLTKTLDFTSDSETGKGPDVIYIVACPAEKQDLSFKFNGTEEYFNVKEVEIVESNYYRVVAPSTYKQTFAITPPDAITGGTITMSPSGNVAWGTEVTISVTPDEGYELTPGSITVTGATSGNSIPVTDNKFTMPQEAVTVSGSFQLKDYDITAETATGGTYTVQSGSPLADVTTAKMGDVITVTPSPAAGYSGGTVTVKKTGTEETVTFDTTNKTFTMPAAEVTITVAFTHDTYAINGTVTPESSGSVTFKKSGSEDGITQAFYGDEITVVDTPADGYELESIKWKEEGGSDEDITSTKTFTMHAKAVTVTVTFKESLTGTINGHNYVTIGNMKWATTNLGATNPEDNGNVYTWGNTTGLSGDSFTPTLVQGNYKSPGKDITADGWKTETHDAAYNDPNWGSSWHMPTKNDFVDLVANGVWIWTTSYKSTGKSGYMVYVAKDKDDKGIAKMSGIVKKWNSSTSSYSTGSFALKGTYLPDKDTHIFFPTAGRGDVKERKYTNYGNYWSSTYFDNENACYLDFGSTAVDTQKHYYRWFGMSVRPVSD